MLTFGGHAPIMLSMTEQFDFAIEPEFTLGWRIKRALDHGGLDHSALMDKFEVSRQTVSRWCRDDGAPPKKYILNEIAVMCGVSARWLISGPGKDGDGPDRGPDPGTMDYKAEVRRLIVGNFQSSSGTAA